MPKKSRSDSISSISSFTFVSQATDASIYQRDRIASGTQRQIESKYKLLSSSDSPPVIRKKDNLSAVGGPSLPSAPILPEENESTIIPKVREKQSVCAIPQSSQGNLDTGCPICSWTWVGLTLILVLHQLAQLPTRFCHIPISPGRIGQTVEHSKSKSLNPVYEHMERPVTI